MVSKKCSWIICLVGLVAIFVWAATVEGRSEAYKENIYPVGKLKPRDSKLKVKVGDQAPNFTLPAVGGGEVSLSQYGFSSPEEGFAPPENPSTFKSFTFSVSSA